MFEFFEVILVWIVGIIGIAIMRKIQPEDVLYPFYVLAICILLTLVVDYQKSWHLFFR